jgi:hypothetical protein
MRLCRFDGRRSGVAPDDGVSDLSSVPDLLAARRVPLPQALKRRHGEDLRFASPIAGPGKSIHSPCRSKPALSIQAKP